MDDVTAVELEPGTPGTEITELPTKPQGSWRHLLYEIVIILKIWDPKAY